MVAPQNVACGKDAMVTPRSNKDGKWNVRFGLGDWAFSPRRSAMKAAFSEDLGRKKMLAFELAVSPEAGTRNPSRASAFSIMHASGPSLFTGKFSAGVKFFKDTTNDSRTKRFHMCSGMRTPHHIPRTNARIGTSDKVRGGGRH